MNTRAPKGKAMMLMYLHDVGIKRLFSKEQLLKLNDDNPYLDHFKEESDLAHSISVHKISNFTKYLKFLRKFQ